MRDIDPQLMRLRELEARIALAEFHLREQEELVERLRARGLDTSLGNQMCETMRAALHVFRKRQDDLLKVMYGDPAHSPLETQAAWEPAGASAGESAGESAGKGPRG